MYKHILFIMTLSCYSTFLFSANEAEPIKNENEKNNDKLKEEIVVTNHTTTINGSLISYTTTVGTQILHDKKNNPKASFFYVAYTKEATEKERQRPITFCFNGGPGSSSVWLHLGTFGPKRVDIDEEGKTVRQPYHLVDNPYSMLDITDLVFIDPISTGYSRVAPGEDAKQYHGVDADVESVAEFIRLYVTRNERWESPKFIAGESYGTTRAVGLADELHEKHHLYLDGIMLLSCVLNFQTIKFSSGNDLPYILYLPSYTSTALYHHRLADELQQDVKKTLKEVEEFAFGEYNQALMLGDNLEPMKREQIIQKLAKYTGLSKDHLDRTNLRINIFRFAKELLHHEKRTIGRFDGRLKGIDSNLCAETFEFDPSFENIIGAFAATFNDYIRRDLNWKVDQEYEILADVWPWSYDNAKNQYLDVGDKLQTVMSKNTSLEIFVANGSYDLATPYFATEYTFSHLGLDPSIRNNVTMHTYEGGHMMYLYHPSLIQLKEDLANFMKKRLDKHN